MTVLKNADTGKCRYWKMPEPENNGTENAGTGKCRYWKMSVLKMLVLENAGTGNWQYWKMPVLENASTGVLPFNILVGCEM